MAKNWCVGALLAGLLLLGGSPSPGGAADSKSAVERAKYAEKLAIPGVSDAGKINDYLYRGAQPSGKGLKELRALHIDTIVDLRGEFRFSLLKRERKHAKALGIQVVSIPGNGWSAPNDKEVAEFFSLVRKQPRRRIFIHCWLGGDRVGLFVAAYRIAFDGWTPDQAIQEMHQFHFKSHWHPGMARYVRGFPERLAHSPELAPYRREQAAGAADVFGPSAGKYRWRPASEGGPTWLVAFVGGGQESYGDPALIVAQIVDAGDLAEVLVILRAKWGMVWQSDEDPHALAVRSARGDEISAVLRHVGRGADFLEHPVFRIGRADPHGLLHAHAPAAPAFRGASLIHMFM
jgi:tyrosine-protein phosphatase SIW14